MMVLAAVRLEGIEADCVVRVLDEVVDSFIGVRAMKGLGRPCHHVGSVVEEIASQHGAYKIRDGIRRWAVVRRKVSAGCIVDVGDSLVDSMRVEGICEAPDYIRHDIADRVADETVAEKAG